MNAIPLASRLRGALLGLACSDAVGTTVEFKQRGTFPLVTDMVGGGPFKLKAGEWTDDVYWCSNGRCFDVGGATQAALRKVKVTGNPFSGNPNPESAGNGCIMRFAPVSMYFYPDKTSIIKMSGDSSWTTHAADECI